MLRSATLSDVVEGTRRLIALAQSGNSLHALRLAEAYTKMAL
jgi:hypothetical protein